MKYVKKSAQILLVDDSEVPKYVQNGFEEFTPPQPEKAGAKDGKSSK